MLNNCPHCQQRQDPRGELEVIASCMRAVADLMIPEPNLEAVNRDAIATLMGYLSDRNRQAQAAYFAAVHASRDEAPEKIRHLNNRKAG